MNPREELFVLKSLVDTTSDSSEVLQGLMSAPVSTTFLHSTVALNANECLQKAYDRVLAANIRYALVEKDPDVLLGVFDRDKVGRLISQMGGMAERFTVSSFVSRRISLEPDTACLKDVTERLLHGSAQYIVLVNQRGRPITIITAQMLKEFFEYVAGVCHYSPSVSLRRVAS